MRRFHLLFCVGTLERRLLALSFVLGYFSNLRRCGLGVRFGNQVWGRGLCLFSLWVRRPDTRGDTISGQRSKQSCMEGFWMTEDGSSRGPDRPGIPSGMNRSGIVGGSSRPGFPSGMSRPGVPSGPRKPVAPGGPNTRWPQYVQFMVVVTLTVLFLVLAISMQRHHFMNGEFYDRSHPTESTDQ
jgi:hypothetical protein